MQVIFINENGEQIVFDASDTMEPTGTEPAARDWAAFFTALAAFIQMVMPIVVDSFFQQKDATK